MKTTTQTQRSPGCGPGFEEQLELGFALSDAALLYRKMPEAGTMRAAVLESLRAGKALTSGQAWKSIGTSRLAADIYALRSYGWPIEAVELQVPTRSGRTARIARYSLVEAG